MSMLPPVATEKGAKKAAKPKKTSVKNADYAKSSGSDKIAPAAEVRSVAELIEALSHRSDKEIVWYRGHNKASHPLIPSLARPPKNVDAEMTLVKRFRQNAYPFL